MSDSMSPHVSRTLLSILADLNNAIFWMFSAFPPIFIIPNPMAKLLKIVPNVSITSGDTVTFQFLRFLVQWQDLSICPFFAFFDFHSVVDRDGEIRGLSGLFFPFFFLFSFFFFFIVNYHYSCRDLVNCLYLKIPMNSVHLIFQNVFWFLHIPSGSMVKFNS